jgi:uncharacterized protein (DUF2267 family)
MQSRRLYLIILAAVALAVAAWRRPINRQLRAAGREQRRAWRRAAGRVRGRFIARRVGPPPAGVDDDVIADRVRSALGPVVATRDVPHPHVMVQHGVALLHGDVATACDAQVIERTTASVSGVRRVQSHLHVGLLPSDTRPTKGRASQPASAAMKRLIASARSAGLDTDGDARQAVGAVLGTLVDRLPRNERRQFVSHLPLDVRMLTEAARPPRPYWPMRRRADFVLAVEARAPVPAGRANGVIRNVLGTVRQLVPEEATDVAAVLPVALRRLWREAVPI